MNTVAVPLGIVEGFFGKPWTGTARLAYAEFLATRGFNFYVYAPKADAYLRRRWREPIPAEELAELGRLAARFRANGLKFGVGLTPFEIHLNYSSDAKAALREKVAQLDQAGVDILCILFDDMRGDFPRLAALQAEVVVDITDWSSATAFIVAPTYYSDDPILERVFGPAPKNYLRDLGRDLDPAIDVFWTGQKVCSAGYPDPHLADVADRLGRKPFIWDNHTANDGKVRCSHLYLDPGSAGWSLNSRSVAGVAINPMNQPGLARVPLAVYAAILGGVGSRQEGAILESQIRSVCGAALGAEILRDLDLFQNRGLSEADGSARAILIEKYRRFEPNWCALEIGAWLRGEYDFDPNCLTE